MPTQYKVLEQSWVSYSSNFCSDQEKSGILLKSVAHSNGEHSVSQAWGGPFPLTNGGGSLTRFYSAFWKELFQLLFPAGPESSFWEVLPY